MRDYHRRGARRNPSWSFILLCVLLVTLLAAGGASRGDVPGQVIVRGVCWSLLAIAALLVARPTHPAGRPVLILLCAALALVLLQLVPLPPAVWQALPGRTLFVDAAVVADQPQPWRPWSLVPWATLNAASSLVVPFTTLLLVIGMREDERPWLPGLVLVMISVSTFVGLLQFSGVQVENPLINDSPGEVGGIFANRNHYALFVAIGCLLAPVWAFMGGRKSHWRGPIALGLVPIFVLTILATGSRAGMILGVLGIVFGLVLTREPIKRTLSHYPRWAFSAIAGGTVAVIALLVTLSILANRAISINRALELDAGQDMRSRGLPVVLTMIREYFPMGTGFGSFDPMFRLHEPFGLLKFTYFNHAHNDFLEIALNAGVPGLLVLSAALLWWMMASFRVWRTTGETGQTLPRLGSLMLLFVVLASVFDYPARTPMIMAIVIIASFWLSSGLRRDGPVLSVHLR
jgi:O-antigen ligase